MRMIWSRPRELIARISGMLLGVAVLASGLFALPNPHVWFLRTPGVADTGPYNPHFVRDVAIAYIVSGLAFIAGAIWSTQRPGLWTVATGWLVGHAAMHVWEYSTGMCTRATFSAAVPGVLLPAAFALLLQVWMLVMPHKST